MSQKDLNMIDKIIKNHRLVLASSSPRRQELFKMLGLSFLVRISDVDEPILECSPESQAMTNAKNKALAVRDDDPSEIIVAADTLVVLDGKLLGKPKNKDEAFAFLSALQGKKHHVITGICIVKGDAVRTSHEISSVYFAEMDESEIRDYIATNEPMDKAGAYGIQGFGSQFVKRIEGCYFNVMGFPIHLFYKTLKSMQNEGIL